MKKRLAKVLLLNICMKERLQASLYGEAENFRIRMVVQQGLILSPYLISPVIDKITNIIQDEVP